MARPSKLEVELSKRLTVKPGSPVKSWGYDEWLEYFRIVPNIFILQNKDFLQRNITSEGFAAASRWIEIVGNPSKMDKLYQGRLRDKERESIMDLAVGDDDEAFYEALIRENVQKLDESRNSAQEVARITQNLNIFRKQLKEIRSRKPKKGSVLERVLELSSRPTKSPPKPKEKPRQTTKKRKKTTKKKGKKMKEPTVEESARRTCEEDS